MALDFLYVILPVSFALLSLVRYGESTVEDVRRPAILQMGYDRSEIVRPAYLDLRCCLVHRGHRIRHNRAAL